MTAPAALLLLVFHYLPTLGNVIAFQDYNPFEGDNALEAFLNSEWIGFGNFETLFADPAFWDAVRNTLSITAFQLVFFFPLPIVLALLLHSVLVAAAARLHSGRGLPAALLQLGARRSRSSCRCSAAPGCSPRSCDATASSRGTS